MQTTEYKKAKVNKLRNSHLEDGFRQTVKNKKTTVHCELSCRQWKSSAICSMLGKSVCIVPCLDNIYKQTQIPFLTVALYTKALLLTKMLLCFHAIFKKKKRKKKKLFFLSSIAYYLSLLFAVTYIRIHIRKYGSMHNREYLFCGVNFIIPTCLYICIHMCAFCWTDFVN